MSTTTQISFQPPAGMRFQETVEAESSTPELLVFRIGRGGRLACLDIGDEICDVVIETVTVVRKPSDPSAQLHSQPSRHPRLRVVEMVDPGPPQLPQIRLLVIEAAQQQAHAREGE